MKVIQLPELARALDKTYWDTIAKLKRGKRGKDQHKANDKHKRDKPPTSDCFGR